MKQGPVGRPEDIKWAQEHVQQTVGTRIINGTFRPSQQQIDAVPKQMLAMFAFPCFWPITILMFPCLIMECKNAIKNFENIVYILTDREIIAVLKDYKPSGTCCSPGTDTTMIPYESIQSVTIDNKGLGCCSSFQVSAVKIHSAADKIVVTDKGRTIRIPLTAVVEDTAEFSRMINESWDRAKAARSQVHAAPAADSSAPAAKRVFVSLASDTNATKIVNIKSSNTLEFFAAIAEAFGLDRGVKFKLSLKDVGADVSSPDELQANDKVVATLL